MNLYPYIRQRSGAGYPIVSGTLLSAIVCMVRLSSLHRRPRCGTVRDLVGKDTKGYPNSLVGKDIKFWGRDPSSKIQQQVVQATLLCLVSVSLITARI